MMKLSVSYVRQGDQVLAFHEDKMIAHGTRFAEVEKTAVEYLDNLRSKEDADIAASQRKAATHVETPSGLKGEVLGQVKGPWGSEEVTVRWENGRIAKYETDGHPHDGYKYSIEEKHYDSALDYLQSTLDEPAGADRQSLTARIHQLDDVLTKAAAVVAGGQVSFTDEKRVHNMALEAEHEKIEIREALAHLEAADAEAFAPPVSEFKAVEQADLGHTSNWLDDAVDDMIREAEDQDFDKLLSEEPLIFVADLETPALADTGITREMATQHIRTKTAGLVGDDIENFRTQFLARVEVARKDELKDRTKRAKKTAQKTAKKEASSDFLDDALFM